MAGKIKLDGTQFLEKVNNEFKITNSELKLKSTGNTIVDSSGNAVVSESGGTITLTADETNVGSNALVVDSSGNVGIGTSSPERLLEVDEASGDAFMRFRASDTGGGADTIFENLVADNGQNNYIYFGDLDDRNIGMIRYSHANDFMSFTTNALEAMRIESNGDFKFNSGYGSVATAYGCRAWVNFNGTGTVAIRDSGNVSSITDTGTGNYTVNLATAMPDENYAISFNGYISDTSGVGDGGEYSGHVYSKGTGAFNVSCLNLSGASAGSDFVIVDCAIFR